MNASFGIVFLALMLCNCIESKRRVLIPKDLEAFCGLYPLHRKCMGAFAGGGKRTISTPEESFDPIRSRYREVLLKALAVLRQLEQVEKQLSSSEEVDDPLYDDVYTGTNKDSESSNLNDNMMTSDKNNKKNDDTRSQLIELLTKLKDREKRSSA